jgi:hypothetical protein
MAIVLTSSGPLDRLHAGASRLKGRAARLWRAYPRETIGVGLFGLVAAAAVTTTAIYNGQPKQPQIAPPAPPPMLVKPIAPTEAVKVNAEIPVASGPSLGMYAQLVAVSSTSAMYGSLSTWKSNPELGVNAGVRLVYISPCRMPPTVWSVVRGDT